MRRIWSFLEYLNESSHSSDYRPGMDVTKMPIIANVIVREIGDIKASLSPIVAIVKQGKHLLFISNKLYKDRPDYKEPYLYLAPMIEGIYWEKWKKIK